MRPLAAVFQPLPIVSLPKVKNVVVNIGKINKFIIKSLRPTYLPWNNAT
jgi:hypothetical protein